MNTKFDNFGDFKGKTISSVKRNEDKSISVIFTDGTTAIIDSDIENGESETFFVFDWVDPFNFTGKKFAFAYEKEEINDQWVSDTFGGVTNHLHDTAKSAHEEIAFSKLEEESHFSQMESQRGPAVVVEIDFVNGKIKEFKRLT